MERKITARQQLDYICLPINLPKNSPSGSLWYLVAIEHLQHYTTAYYFKGVNCAVSYAEVAGAGNEICRFNVQLNYVVVGSRCQSCGLHEGILLQCTRVL